MVEKQLAFKCVISNMCIADKLTEVQGEIKESLQSMQEIIVKGLWCGTTDAPETIKRLLEQDIVDVNEYRDVWASFAVGLMSETKCYIMRELEMCNECHHNFSKRDEILVGLGELT